MRLELPNQQILLHPPSSFKASQISSKGNKFFSDRSYPPQPLLGPCCINYLPFILGIFNLSLSLSLSLSLPLPWLHLMSLNIHETFFKSHKNPSVKSVKNVSHRSLTKGPYYYVLKSIPTFCLETMLPPCDSSLCQRQRRMLI